MDEQVAQHVVQVGGEEGKLEKKMSVNNKPDIKKITKSSLYSRYYAEACKQVTRPISAA